MKYMNSNVATTQTNNVKVCMLRLPGCLCRFLTSRKLCASKLPAVTLGSLAISKPFRWTTKEKGAVSSNRSYGTLITRSYSILNFR